MKGKRAGVCRILYKELCHLEHLGHLVVIKIPEFRSSKVCSKCNMMTLENIHEKIDGRLGSSLHSVLNCKNCNTVWNRDVNASRNLHYIATYMAANENRRPDIFTQSTSTIG